MNVQTAAAARPRRPYRPREVSRASPYTFLFTLDLSNAHRRLTSANMGASTPARCAQCGASATKVCAGCLYGVNTHGAVLPPVHYCTQKCQKEHWRAGYEGACKLAKQRKQLYAAGKLIQAQYYELRRASFDVPIFKVKQSNNGQLFVFAAYSEPEDDVSIPFLEQLFTSENEKKAILVWCACNDAPTWMHLLIHQPLKVCCYRMRPVTSSITMATGLMCCPQGLTKDPQDVIVRASADSRRVVYRGPHGQMPDACI